MKHIKVMRITTVALSLRFLLDGQMKFLTNNGYEVIMVSANDDNWVPILEQRENCTHISIPFTRSITPLKDLIALFKLITLIRKIRPSIVHTHTPKAGLLGMIASWFCGIPVRIHTLAGMPLMENSGLRRSMLEVTEKITYKTATTILPNSYGLTKYILNRKWVRPEKVRVIGNGSSNGIDTDEFCPSLELQMEADKIRDDLNISENDFVFIFIGRMVKDKGIAELTSAFESLSENNKAHLILVGGQEKALDPLDNHTIGRIKDIDQIYQVGFKDNVKPYLAAANALILPSYREGFPNVLLQAGSMGLPSIATDIIGCNEIIQNNINGLLVAPKNSNSLCKAMTFLINEPLKCKEMGKSARARVLEKYSQSFFWSEMLKTYKELAN